MSFAPVVVALLVLAVFAVASWVLLRRARRLIALVRRLSTPAGVAGLLSPATREALERAGHDPDALRPQTELTPELRRLVSADVARAFREALLSTGGRGERPQRAAPPPSPTPLPMPGQMPTPPLPYDANEPGRWLRWAAAAAIVAAAAGVLLLAR